MKAYVEIYNHICSCVSLNIDVYTLDRRDKQLL